MAFELVTCRNSVNKSTFTKRLDISQLFFFSTIFINFLISTDYTPCLTCRCLWTDQMWWTLSCTLLKPDHRLSKPTRDEWPRFKWPCWLLNSSFDCGQRCCVLALGYNYVWIYKSLSNRSWNLYIQFTRKNTNFLVNYSLLERLKRCHETSKLSN